MLGHEASPRPISSIISNRRTEELDDVSGSVWPETSSNSSVRRLEIIEEIGLGLASCPSITLPARSDAQGSVTLWSSPACSTLSLSRARSSSGGALVFLRLSEGGASGAEGEFGDWQDTVRLRYRAKMERLFPAHLVVRFCCSGQRVRPQFYYALSC